MSGPVDDFPDEAIRTELKRMVERTRSETTAEFERTVSETLDSKEGNAEQRDQIADKLKRAGELASTRFDQMIDFIDRNA